MRKIVECVISANAFMVVVFNLVFIVDFEQVLPAGITGELRFIGICFYNNILTLAMD